MKELEACTGMTTGEVETGLKTAEVDSTGLKTVEGKVGMKKSDSDANTHVRMSEIDTGMVTEQLQPEVEPSSEARPE